MYESEVPITGKLAELTGGCEDLLALFRFLVDSLPNCEQEEIARALAEVLGEKLRIDPEFIERPLYTGEELLMRIQSFFPNGDKNISPFAVLTSVSQKLGSVALSGRCL